MLIIWRNTLIKNYEVLKNNITMSIQESGLDIGAVYFIIKNIYSEIEKMYYVQINKELIEENKKEEGNASKANSSLDNAKDVKSH